MSKKKQEISNKKVYQAEIVEWAAIDIRDCEEKISNYLKNPSHFTSAYLESVLDPMLSASANLYEIAKMIRSDK